LATAHHPALGRATVNRRVIEWGMMAAIVLTLIVVLLREVRFVQGQAELASVRSTLGTLRMAATLDHIRKGATGLRQPVAEAQPNPFLSLQQRPGDYLGELTLQQSLGGPSGWFFEPLCSCVGYIPTDARWLSPIPEAPVLLFRVSVGAGPPQLDAMGEYRWQGEVIR